MYKFLKVVWHFPEGDDCYEEVLSEEGGLTLAQALRRMILWLDKYPNAYTENDGVGVIECSDDISDDGQQYSARIEEE